jgi:hypothetical protein
MLLMYILSPTERRLVTGSASMKKRIQKFLRRESAIDHGRWNHMICAAALPSVRKRRFSLSGRPASASTNRGDGEGAPAGLRSHTGRQDLGGFRALMCVPPGAKDPGESRNSRSPSHHRKLKMMSI